MQGDGESIQDFAYMYVPMSLMETGFSGGKRNSTYSQKYPSSFGQLRSSKVATVDALVRLGQQLEMDRGKALGWVNNWRWTEGKS